MKKVMLHISCLLFVSIGILTLINMAVIAEEKETETAVKEELSDDEVIIHSPLSGDQIAEDELDVDVEVPDVLLEEDSDEKIDELFKFLEKEQNYLKQLDEKYDSISVDEEEVVNEGETMMDAFREKFKDGDAKIDTLKEEFDKGNAKVDALKEKFDNGDSKKDKEVYESGKVKPDVSKTDAEAKADVVKDEKGDKEDEIDYNNPFDAAEVFYELGKYEKALNTYKLLRPDYPKENDYIWSQFQIANCLRNMRKFNESIKEYQDFINKYPDNFWAEQAAWYMEDAKWWLQWNSRIRTPQGAAETETTESQ